MATVKESQRPRGRDRPSEAASDTYGGLRPPVRAERPGAVRRARSARRTATPCSAVLDMTAAMRLQFGLLLRRTQRCFSHLQIPSTTSL
jgi:hypothetical protein